MYKERPLKRWPFCSARRCFRCGAAGGRQAGRLWFQNMQDIHLSCGAANPISLIAQTGSTLGTAASQHLAAIAGRHSLSEAMLLLSVELLGLIGSQHVKNPPFRLYALKLLNCRCPGYPIPIDSSRHPRLSRARNPIGFIPIGNFPVSFYGIPYQQASLLFTSCFLITWLVQIRFFFTEKLKQEIKLQNKKRQGISLAP